MLDSVMISAEALKKWHELCKSKAPELQDAGVSPADIPDEQCSRQDDGNLLISVDIPEYGRIQMSIPPEQWQWKC